MTLLDAKQYDATRDRRMRNWIFVAVIVILIVAWTAYHLRDYRERSHVAQFFSALQQKNFGAAYGIWFNDPDWQKHPNKFKDYS
jgi:lipoprotein signal peptidase